MRGNISPEEKLLRLIRGSKKQDKDKSQPASIQAVTHTPKAQVGPVKYRLPFEFSSPLLLTKIITASFIIACIYLLSAFLQPLLMPAKIPLADKGAKETAEPEDMPRQDIKPFEFYEQALGNRRIFASMDLQEEIRPVKSGLDADLIKDISLLGIITGDNPQAIIEDKKSQKTYYVNKGQIFGEFRLEEIQEGKIILNYKGQRYELFL